MTRFSSSSIAARMLSAGSLLLLGPCFLTGCRHGGGTKRDDAVVRLINAAPQIEDLSVAVDGQKVWKNSQFQTNTGFTGVGAGTYQVDMTARTNRVILRGHNFIQCVKGKAYTVLALDPGAASSDAPRLRIFSEDRGLPVPGDKARVRFIDAADGTQRLDVLFNNIVGFANVPFGARSEPVLLDPGAYALKVNVADEVASLAGPVPVRLEAGHAYTLVAMRRRAQESGSTDLILQAYPDGP